MEIWDLGLDWRKHLIGSMLCNSGRVLADADGWASMEWGAVAGDNDGRHRHSDNTAIVRRRWALEWVGHCELG